MMAHDGTRWSDHNPWICLVIFLEGRRGGVTFGVVRNAAIWNGTSIIPILFHIVKLSSCSWRKVGPDISSLKHTLKEDTYLKVISIPPPGTCWYHPNWTHEPSHKTVRDNFLKGNASCANCERWIANSSDKVLQWSRVSVTQFRHASNLLWMYVCK